MSKRAVLTREQQVDRLDKEMRRASRSSVSEIEARWKGLRLSLDKSYFARSFVHAFLATQPEGGWATDDSSLPRLRRACAAGLAGCQTSGRHDGKYDLMVYAALAAAVGSMLEAFWLEPTQEAATAFLTALKDMDCIDDLRQADAALAAVANPPDTLTLSPFLAVEEDVFQLGASREADGSLPATVISFYRWVPICVAWYERKALHLLSFSHALRAPGDARSCASCLPCSTERSRPTRHARRVPRRPSPRLASPRPRLTRGADA